NKECLYASSLKFGINPSADQGENEAYLPIQKQLVETCSDAQKTVKSDCKGSRHGLKSETLPPPLGGFNRWNP
ncbi:MAG: hypothetical protein WAJ95_21435, partial [Desulfobacterales bacterium]